MFQIKIDTKDIMKVEADFKNLDKNFPKLGEKVRIRLAQRTKTLARNNIQPRWINTGYLKDSIILRKEGNNSTDVIAGAPYAGYVEMGTKPHSIEMPTGSRGDKLAYGWTGNIPQRTDVLTTIHKHPGAGKGRLGRYPSMNFMERAYFQMLEEADNLIDGEFDKFFKERGW